MRPLWPRFQQLPQHVVVRSLAGPCAEEQDRVVRLDRIEGEVAGYLFAHEEAFAFAQQEQARCKGRRFRPAGIADEDDVELQPGVLSSKQFPLVVQDRTADGIRPSCQPLFISRGELLLLTARKTRLPVTQAEGRVLARLVRYERPIRLDAQHHQVAMAPAELDDRGVVLLFAEFRDLFGLHGTNPGASNHPAVLQPGDGKSILTAAACNLVAGGARPSVGGRKYATHRLAMQHLRGKCSDDRGCLYPE